MSSSKSLHLFDLGEDIIRSDIIPNLAPNDIQSLGSTCHYLHEIANESSVWHQIYEKTFGIEPTPFAFTEYQFWPQMYTLRRTAKLMTWGKSSSGRLGYSMREVPRDHVARRGLASSVNKPTIVKDLQDTIIADVSAGGFSFQILTSKGMIYSTGVTWNGGLSSGPGPSEPDGPESLPTRTHSSSAVAAIGAAAAAPPPTGGNTATSWIPEMGAALTFPRFRLGGVIPRTTQGVPPPPTPGYRPPAPTPTSGSQPDSGNQTPRTTVMPDREIHQTPPDLRSEEDREPISRDSPNTQSGFIRKMKPMTNIKYISVSSGRAHFIALDDSGQIWTWDHPRQGITGIQLKLVDAADNNVCLTDNNANIVTKIVAGWNLSCCYILNIGIVYWKSRDPLHDRGSNSTANAHCHIIPGTQSTHGHDKIIDIVAGESFIVYLTQAGKIYRVDVDNSNEGYELSRFNNYLTRHSESSAETPSRFVRLSGGSYRTFVAISDEDLVLLGTKDSNHPEVIAELQKQNVISVAVGDYHCLALTKDGQLLSWGLESDNCGCLGLGDPAQYVESGSGELVGRNGFRAKKPIKVDIEGKVLAIGAAGWQSCAIVNVDVDHQ